MERYYIYGITNGRGLPPGLPGIDDRPVQQIVVGDLAAVVSCTWRESFEDLHEDALLALAGRHEEVHRALLESGDLVPFRFGMVAADQEEVERTVASLSLQLKAALERLSGRVELVVQASWDHDAVLAECAADAEMAALRDEFTRDPSLERQIEVGRRLFELVEARRQRSSQRVVTSLTPLAVAVALNRLLRPEMILNAAFLVDKEREEEFDEAVHKVAERERGELEVRYIGPLAAYSFSALEIRRTAREALEAARATLELHEVTTLLEIKEAFRRLARENHPDRAGSTAEAYQRYQEIVAAYDLLTTYCENYQHRFNADEGPYVVSGATDSWEALHVS